MDADDLDPAEWSDSDEGHEPSSEIEFQGAMERAMAELAAAERAAEEAALAVTSEGRLREIKDNAPDMKVELALRQHTLEQRRAEVVLKARELEQVVKARMSEVEALLRPMRKQLALMSEGIQTLNLYLGRDEYIECVREGEPADVDEPISIRQMVLSMDQESMLMASDGGMDFNDIGSFVKWCLADDANLDQMLPERKGVVVLVPHMGGKDYSNDDAWSAAQKNAANNQSWWMIRNGERLYLMTTDLDVGSHLVPKADEFTKMFERDKWGDPIKPGSSAWFEAEERADARKRHFMKIAMVLQGLIDRTTVFYPSPPHVSVLTMDSYDAGHVRVVTDAERAIGSGLEPYDQWHARICSNMRPGMRVVWANNSAWRNSRNYDDSRRGDSRISVEGASLPQEGEIYTLEKGKGQTLRFRYERTDKRWGYEHGDWGRYGEWEYVRKGVYCEVQQGDRFVIPVDLVTAAEIRRYMESRQERWRYKDFLPLLKSALAAREAEEAQEAPFRTLLIGKLMHASGDDQETVEAVIDGYIQQYKLGNKWHRPLVGLTVEEQSKAIRQINGMYMHGRNPDVSAEAAQVAKILTLYPDTALVLRAADGTYTSLQPQPDEERVHVKGLYWIKRTWTKTGKAKEVKEWHHQVPPRTRALHSTEVWESRDQKSSPSEIMTWPEVQETVARLVERHGDDLIAIAWRKGSDYSSSSVYRKLAMYRLDGDTLRIPNDLIDGRIEPASIERKTVEWKRAGGEIQLNYSMKARWANAQRSRDCEPWNTTVRVPGKDFEYTEVDLGLWTNPAEIERYEAMKAEYERATRISGKLNSDIRRAIDFLTSAWIAVEWERLHAEFLVEYQGHEELWESHKASIPSPRFPYSWLREEDPRVGKGQGALRGLLALALSAGLDIHGRTLSEIMTVLGDRLGKYAKVEWIEGLTDIRIEIRKDEDEE